MIDKENLADDELKKENRALKRKLMLVEANLKRVKAVSDTQNRADAILRDSTKRELQYFKLVLENATNILLLFDVHGYFAYASDQFLKEAGIANFGLIKGKHYKDVFGNILSDEELREFTNNLESVIKQKRTISVEEELDFSTAGEARTYNIIITPMIDDSGSASGIMALFNDITEINNALTVAKQANFAKSEFLANMSHEIRTPLNAIIGMTMIAKNSDDIERLHYCLSKIDDSSTHLLGIVNDILDMSKIETNHLELSFTEFVFMEMLDRVIDIVRLNLEEKNIAFDMYCDPEIPDLIKSDERRLSQIILNLLSNAVKFTPVDGSIRLRAYVEHRGRDDFFRLRMSVQDSGIGITDEQKPRLFKVFSQADASTSRQYGGTGLGLAISKSIAKMMGGDIWFDSKEGEGTTFTFTIMAKACQQPVPALENTSLISGEPGEKAGAGQTNEMPDYSGKTILIVDDVDINREILISLLEPTGINIICAENGKDAVEKYLTENGTIELVFMDIQMPVMDGYKATKRIRESGREDAEEIPIVAMTANVLREDVERCLEAGMSDHIGKPISIEEIIKKIGHWTG